MLLDHNFCATVKLAIYSKGKSGILVCEKITHNAVIRFLTKQGKSVATIMNKMLLSYTDSCAPKRRKTCSRRCSAKEETVETEMVGVANPAHFKIMNAHLGLTKSTESAHASAKIIIDKTRVTSTVLQKVRFDIWNYLHYRPDLTPNDYYQFPKIKNKSKGENLSAMIKSSSSSIFMRA